MIDRLQRERFIGFAEKYDKYRPVASIDMLRSIIGIYGSVNNIKIADIGCGTGLSTFPWSKYAKQIFGIEPNPEMIQVAKKRLKDLPVTNITFLKGDSIRIPIVDNEIDLITCSQSFHWMEPRGSLKEFGRILKPNGLLAIYDCDWPPSVGEFLEIRFRKVITTAFDVLRDGSAEATQWPKSLHLQNIRESELFCFEKEICFEQTMKLNAAGYIGMIESLGAIQQAIKEKSEQFINTLEETKKEIKEEMKNQNRNAIMTYRLRLAIKFGKK